MTTTLSEARLAELRSRLEAAKAEAERRLAGNDHYGLADSLREETGELSAIDNHPADVGSEMFERGKDVALLEKDDLRLRRIDAALHAISEGTYGRCLTCGEAIPYERLEAVPDTLYCKKHSPRQEVSLRRPAEEDMLDNPFGRSSMDEESSYNGFDGEDAWQIVESWGNSDSPALAENPNDASYDDMSVENDESDGYVEPLESFLATDITGRHISVVRNREYRDYLERREGDRALEVSEEP
ncbi:TraR/DksA C4-type zinc finger protein [Paenibacillus cisolokensis]|uniref:Zinc finger DksA/TraR C4-type domain-containing protein n=1 Tax=Paenibacillus cisolokensis TaxID=1658519 RepID=A0ABQ4N7L4_9BACL|nr:MULTISPECIES: TraR/DksA C4-type zinc finger protein [Paenibacillus]ALS27372.1 molecular chaperone DnaK [Paenibacillus sp. 32O-W]GIQ64160.1 hypothetical protein PACILC2_27280 [Paenibacillus cisolokensis]